MRTELARLRLQVLQTAEGPPSGAVILCHGFGAPGDDLVGLHAALVAEAPALASVRFVFPSGPVAIDEEWSPARAWWMFDVELLTGLQRGDASIRDALRRAAPDGLAEARQRLSKLVDEVCRTSGLAPGKVVLGGFSQGAMLATEVALRLEEAPAGLVLLSGTVINQEAWRERAPMRAGLRVFQSHGRSDPLLDFDAARELEALLTAAGLVVDFVPFQGGHGIPPELLPRLASYLSERIVRPASRPA